MIVALLLIIFGLIVILHPEILAFLFGGFLIMLGLGIMAAGWQFRRMHKRANSQIVNWIFRW